MKFFSKDEYINGILKSSIFQKKATRIKEALTSLGEFSEDIEVFRKNEDDLVYAKDNKGIVYTFTIDNSFTDRNYYYLEKRTHNFFSSYNYLYELTLERQGYYFDDEFVLSKNIMQYKYEGNYTLEKGNERYTLFSKDDGVLLDHLRRYCINNQENENFESFLMFCKSFSIEPGYDIILNYYNKDNNTDIKAKLCFGNVKEFCLVIDSQSEIVRLTYKDGNFNEDYQVIRRITEKELSDENKTTVGSVKKLIK